MFANIDYALATARVSDMQRDHRFGSDSTRESLGERLRRRRAAARRARDRRSSRPRLRAA